MERAWDTLADEERFFMLCQRTPKDVGNHGPGDIMVDCRSNLRDSFASERGKTLVLLPGARISYHLEAGFDCHHWQERRAFLRVHLLCQVMCERVKTLTSIARGGLEESGNRLLNSPKCSRIIL